MAMDDNTSDEGKTACDDDVCFIPLPSYRPERSTTTAELTASRSRRGSTGLYVRYTTWLVVAIGGVVGWIVLSSRSSAAGYGALAVLVGIVGLRRVRKDRKFSDEGGVEALVRGSRPVILEFSSEL